VVATVIMNKKVKISKLSKAENALYDAPPIHDYVMGEDNGNVSLPIDYWLEGFLTEELAVGKPIVVSRTNRNGVEIGGIFTTSTVTEITKDGFKTLNSVYKLEYI
jgi:hypothetical protein